MVDDRYLKKYYVPNSIDHRSFQDRFLHNLLVDRVCFLHNYFADDRDSLENDLGVRAREN